MESFTINLPEGITRAQVLGAIALANGFSSTVKEAQEVSLPHADVLPTDAVIQVREDTTFVMRIVEVPNPETHDEFALRHFELKMLRIFNDVQDRVKEAVLQAQITELRNAAASDGLTGGSVS